MKIAFVGKGGVGKTTLAALFARSLAQSGVRVFAIDADINQHLGETLGLSKEEQDSLPALAYGDGIIKEYVIGSNKRIRSAEYVMKTTPPGAGSRLISLREDPNILSAFWKDAGRVKAMRTGPLDDSDIGIRCFHGKVTVVETLLNHLADRPDDYVIVDMTAGADAFSSGLFTRFDVIFLVAEPARKSFDVYRQFKEYGAKYGLKVKVVGNKIGGPEDEGFIRSAAGGDHVGSFGISPYVKSVERGSFPPIADLEPAHAQVLSSMRKEVDATTQDWDRLYLQNVAFHRQNAESWMNARTGQDLTSQIDPGFSLSLYVKKYLSA